MGYSASETIRIGLTGGEALVLVEVTPDGATGNFDIDDATTVYPLAVIPLTEDPAANAQVAVQAVQNDSTANQVDCKLWKATNDAAGAYKKFAVLCKIVT